MGILKFPNLIFFLSLLFVSCTPPSSLPPTPLPISPFHIKDKITKQNEYLGALKGWAKVKISSPKGNNSLEEIILLKKPNFLRMETIGFGGIPSFFLVLKGREVSFLNPSENRFYQGSANPFPLSYLLSLKLSTEEIVDLLLGRISPLNYQEESLPLSFSQNIYLLEVKRGNQGYQLIGVDPFQGYIKWAKTYNELAQLIWQVKFSSYLEKGEISFPLKIELNFPLEQTQITIEYEEEQLVLNPILNPKELQLIPPPGSEIINLDKRSTLNLPLLY